MGVSNTKFNIVTQVLLTIAFLGVLFHSLIKFTSEETGTKFFVETNPFPNKLPSLAVYLCPIFYKNPSFSNVTLTNLENVEQLPKIRELVRATIWEYQSHLDE